MRKGRGIFGLFLISSLLIVTGFSVTVPYDELRLVLSGETEFETLFMSMNEIKSGSISVRYKQISNSTFTEMIDFVGNPFGEDSININTISPNGYYSDGRHTMFWIKPNITVGSQHTIGLNGQRFVVRSLSENISVSSLGNLETIVLEHSESLSDTGRALYTFYFEKQSGLLVRWLSEGFIIEPTYKIPIKLNMHFSINDNGIDLDNDGLTDLQEILRHRTSPTNKDTDNDSLSDKEELDRKTNPFIADTDGDGLADNDELSAKTNPLLEDTDFDGLSDGKEIELGTNPFPRTQTAISGQILPIFLRKTPYFQTR